jgi:DUF438 domain-containing protein
MEQSEIFSAILDSLTEEVVFVDTDHIIRYMNSAGKKHYAKFGDILGKSLFVCHKEQSATRIKDIFRQLAQGVDEVLYLEDEKRRIYMRAVRDREGRLVGYMERYLPR